jgi:hypothetical protein
MMILRWADQRMMIKKTNFDDRWINHYETDDKTLRYTTTGTGTVRLALRSEERDENKRIEKKVFTPNNEMTQWFSSSELP